MKMWKATYEDKLVFSFACIVLDEIQSHSPSHRLWESQVMTQGALYLADALKSNVGLKTLNVRENGIADEGLTAFMEAIKFNVTITELRLEDNPQFGDYPPLLEQIKTVLADPVRAAWASGEADTKPACEIPLEHRD
eukprot:m.135167 g.135167  ORF g.135167 m.135167 type:complete len:137 (-) comp14864_c2_seq6:253-663(-)